MHMDHESTIDAATLAARIAARATTRDLEVEPWPDGSSAGAILAICAAIVGVSTIVIVAFLSM
jgi:hypothetical protein